MSVGKAWVLSFTFYFYFRECREGLGLRVRVGERVDRVSTVPFIDL